MSDNKLPPNARLAFKGQIFEVWQWEQKMYDGSTAVFEKIKRPNTAEVIAVVKDKILIQLQEQPHRPAPFISFPGGRCEEGEDPLEAAKRELLEESGYASEDWELFQQQSPSNIMIWTMYTYVARNCYFKQSPHLDSGEKITDKLISFDEFMSLADEPTFRHQYMAPTLLKARFDPKKREELYNLLFKSK